MRIGVSPILVFQHLHNARMQPHLAAGGKPVVESLLDKGVPELIAFTPTRHHLYHARL